MRTSRFHAPTRIVSTTLAMLIALSIGTAIGTVSASAKSPYKKGTMVQIAGTLVDPEGNAVADAEVMFMAERESRRLLVIGGDDRGPVSMRTTSDADGRFAFDWHWDNYHDRFAIEVVLPAHGDRPATVLEQVDVTELLAGDNPIEIVTEVDEPSLIHFMSRLAAGSFGADERRVLGELGRPGRFVERTEGGTQVREWWFFERGRLYRFEDGGLGQVVHFEPVVPEAQKAE